MPIVVTCTCGRQFKAREEHLGRRASCPQCGASLLIGPPPMPVPNAIHISGEASALTVAKVADEPALSDSSKGVPSIPTSPGMKKVMIIGGVVLAAMLIASVTTAIVMIRNDGEPPPSSENHANPKVITNSIGMKLVAIRAGQFEMGSPNTEVNRSGYGYDEDQKSVTIAKGFYIGVTEVTQRQWKAVMGNNPSRFKGDELPVENVSWDDAVGFCKKLGVKEGKKYRLPKEAEWEYACRAGTTTAYHEGYTEGDLAAVGWYGGDKGNSDGKTHAVGQKKANTWGLYDMHGNVGEWCSNWYSDYYGNEEAYALMREEGTFPVFRGGTWLNAPRNCRAATRRTVVPEQRSDSIGFRVVLEVSDVVTVYPNSPRRTFDNRDVDREANGSDDTATDRPFKPSVNSQVGDQFLKDLLTDSEYGKLNRYIAMEVGKGLTEEQLGFQIGEMNFLAKKAKLDENDVLELFKQNIKAAKSKGLHPAFALNATSGSIAFRTALEEQKKEKAK